MSNQYLLPTGETQFYYDNGEPLANGTVGMYVVNTMVTKTTYSDLDGATPNVNPVVLDGNGRARICGAGKYRQIVKDSNGNTIWDEVISDGGITQFITDVALSTGAALMGWIQSGVGAILRTVQDKLRDTVSVADFGVTTGGTGAANSAAMGAAILALSGSRKVLKGIPGTVSIAGAIGVDFNTSGFFFDANGMVFDYGSGTGAAVKFGGASGTQIQDIEARDVKVIGGTSAAIGLLFQNIARSKFWNPHSECPGVAAKIYALNGGSGSAGTYFNDFFSPLFVNANQDLLIDCEVDVNAYVNNQRFFGGQIYGTLPGVNPKGVYITNANHANSSMSKIEFWGTSIEPIVGAGGRKIYDNGESNLYANCGFEQHGAGTDIEFGPNSQYCEIRGTGADYRQQVIVDGGTKNSYAGVPALRGTFVPAFTNLTVVNGTGGATYAGKWSREGDFVYVTVTITVTGSCTTASTFGTTSISGHPYNVADQGFFGAFSSAAPTIYNNGVFYGADIMYPPTWAAVNSNITMSGVFRTTDAI